MHLRLRIDMVSYVNKVRFLLWPSLIGGALYLVGGPGYAVLGASAVAIAQDVQERFGRS